MADKHSINGSRERKRRLGILALNGTEESRAGDCPEPEELASLLDGTCDRSRRGELLLHLDSCRSCFQEWVELSEVLKADQKEKDGVVLFFSRKKVLAAVGSAFAVAASVVVFMSTPFYQEGQKQTGGTLAPDSVFLETADQKDKEAEAVNFSVAEEEKAEQSTAPATAPSAQLKSRAAVPPAMGKGESHHPQEQLYRRDTVKKAAVPEAKNEEILDGSAQVVGTLADTELSSPDEYQDFLSMMEELCRTEVVDLNREKMLKRARELLEKATLSDGRRRAVIEKAATLLERDIEASELCGRLESVLSLDAIRKTEQLKNSEHHIK